MFCPNCGSKNLIEQNFCRYCGLSLGETAKSLEKQLAFDEKAEQLKKLQRNKKINDFTSIALLVLFATVTFILIYFILTKAVFSGEKVFGGLIVIFFILEFASKMLKKWTNKRKREVEELTQKEFGQKETTKLIEEKPFEPIQSVTENSTELLFVENKTKKL